MINPRGRSPSRGRRGFVSLNGGPVPLRQGGTMSTIPVGDAREQKERRRLANFRREFVEKTPGWYRGEMHLGFTVLVSLGTAIYCWTRIHDATIAEWLIVIPIFLFGNWAEWAGHRYILHRPLPYLRMIYKRHCGTHHQFFTNQDLTYKGQKEWRGPPVPPLWPDLVLRAGVPPGPAPPSARFV